MSIVYLVKGTTGLDEERKDWNSKVFISKPDAETYLTKTQELADRLFKAAYDVLLADSSSEWGLKWAQARQNSKDELSLIDPKNDWIGYERVVYSLEEIELAEPSEN